MNELANGETFVIKIGTSSNLKKNGKKIHKRVLRHLAADVSKLQENGIKFVLIASGARELGGWSNRNEGENDPRPYTAHGQIKLSSAYKRAFRRRFHLTRHVRVGQLLVDSAHLDIKTDDPETGVFHAIRGQWARKFLPTLNENDPLAPKNTTLGDNDTLAQKVGIGLKETGEKVDGAIFLSVSNGTDKQKAMGAGGVDKKAEAITELNKAGIPTFVVEGKDRHVIRNLFRDNEALRAAQRDSSRVVHRHRQRIRL